MGQTQVERTCQHCQKTFLIRIAVVNAGGGKYCSVSCHRNASKKVKAICFTCGKELLIYPSLLKTKNYCNYNCYWESLKIERVEKICIVCLTHFVITTGDIKYGKGRFCSRKCSSEYHRGQNSPSWRGGFKTSRGSNWNSQRNLAYKRDGGICQICEYKPKRNDRKNAVHHIKPYRTFKGDYITANDLLNLITLYHKCHPKAEQGHIAVPRLLF